MKRRIKDYSFLLYFLYVLIPHNSLAADPIDTSVIIRDGDTIVSSGKRFELGFFSPPNSSTRYVGIWYRGLQVTTTIWVANSRSPLRNATSGVLKLIQSGELVLQDESNSTIWSSNTSRILQSPVAQLLDSGNLVIHESNDDRPENYLWQSFDLMDNTLAQDMDMGWNLVTDTERFMRSWRSEGDPFPGGFTVHLNISGYPQVLLKRDNVVLSRVGPWNGIRFSGTGFTRNPSVKMRLSLNSSVAYIREETVHKSVISRFTVNPSGVAQHLTWIGGVQRWQLDNNFPVDICDSYGYCGAHGSCDVFNTQTCSCLERFVPRDSEAWDRSVWTGGCVRTNGLNCSSDVFIEYRDIKMPDCQSSWFNESLTLQECEAECLRKCNCTAYTNLDIRNGGSGCLHWFGDLVDIRQLVGEEQRIYIRMASSELDSGGKKRKLVIAILTSLAGMVVLCFGVVLFIRRRRRRKDETDDQELELPIFDLATINKATNDFALSNKIGEGGFGQVFKGILEDGKEIAVKRLSGTSTQGIEEFKNEVIFIAKLQHRNLVKLLGCCFQRDEKMLVYEYMPHKSLDFILFDRKRSKMLDWPTRFRIINGIARGILYLHQDSRLRIIHRDLKASNILLDNDMNPKISDFGLARSFGGDQTVGNTRRVVGTYGYMSPEYAVDGIFSTKSDVYSFGVLAIEIVTGKRNRGFHHNDHQQRATVRNDLVLALPDRIQAIPDGSAAPPKPSSGWGTSAPRTEIKFDSDGRFDNEYFQQTEESSKFRQEYEMRRIKQDEGLDVIGEGLDTLKNMAHDMNEEMDRQVPLMDEIDTKVDKATTDLKNTNVRLKDTVNQLRSSRNFCIDIILLCIILGIAAYLYNVLRR